MTKQKQIVVLLLLAALTAFLTPFDTGLTVVFWALSGILLVGAIILALKLSTKGS